MEFSKININNTEYNVKDEKARYVTDSIVNILEFGVKNNVREDITNIVNSSLSEHKKLYIPEGEYVISSPIVFDKKYELYGDGYKTKIYCTSDVCLDLSNSGALIKISDLYFVGPNTETSIALNMDTQNKTPAITNSIFSNLRFENFGIGIQSSYIWCNSFYDVSFNSTKKPLVLGNQTNNNNFYSCHFLCGEGNQGLSSFTNNDVNTFIGCEFANEFVATVFAVKLCFYGCYFELLKDDIFLQVGSGNSAYREQQNILIFNNCHHTGNDVTNDKYLTLPINCSGKNTRIISDSMQIYTPGGTRGIVKNPLPKGKPIAYISSHNRHNLATDMGTLRKYDVESGKILMQNNHTGYNLTTTNTLNINVGDKIKVDSRTKGTGIFVVFSDGTNKKYIELSNDTLTKQHTEFVAEYNFNSMVIGGMNKDAGEIDYIVVSKMVDVDDFIKELDNSPYYLPSKPEFIPNNPITVYSDNTNEIWTYNGTTWI